ncbi:MAG: hypothetical protein EA404_10110 [Spirochaetaceae bacterium]|nr:MAG: hypothetical protein EA404_10110 [Spirochaetaceae bacterium]
MQSKIRFGDEFVENNNQEYAGERAAAVQEGVSGVTARCLPIRHVLLPRRFVSTEEFSSADKARNSCYTGFVKKRNITISVDANVARWARIKAAENDTSVSRMLADQLEQQMAQDSEYERAQARFLSKAGRRLRTQNRPYPQRDALHER